MGTDIRNNVKKRRTANRLRLLKVFLYLAAVIGLVVGIYKFLHRPGASFGRLEINGTSLIKETDIIKLGGSEPPFNYFNVSISSLRDQLIKDVRFKKITVEHRLPCDIIINAVEREPALYVANSYHSYLCVDYEGKVVRVVSAIPDAKCPVLVGAKCGNLFVGDDVNNPAVKQVLYFLNNIEASARDKIGEITMNEEQHITLRMQGSFPFFLGEAKHLKDKLGLFTAVYNQIKGKSVNAEYIDLTFAKPYIKLIPDDKK